MSAALWDDESSPPALLFSPPSAVAPQDDTRSSAALPPSVAAALWRGDALGSPLTQTLATSWPARDQELPGGGWPCRSLTEVLQPQSSVCEWRLLAPVLASTMATGKTAVLVGPPQHPHLPGLRLLGLDERQLVWIQADAPARRLWVTGQLIKSNALGALVAWLPQARQEQIRRLQICAQGCDAPVFLCRPMAAEHEPSSFAVPARPRSWSHGRTSWAMPRWRSPTSAAWRARSALTWRPRSCNSAAHRQPILDRLRFPIHTDGAGLRPGRLLASADALMSLSGHRRQQVICWRSIREKQRAALLNSRLLAVYGTWQREGELRSLVAGRLVDLTPLLGRLAPASRDFR